MNNKWRAISVGRKAEFSAITACLLFGILSSGRAQAEFTFDNIEYWVGSGQNRAALVLDWVENIAAPPALAWGYRWDGAATGRDMLLAIVEADDRLYAKFNITSDNMPTLVYGLGYDIDDDEVFGISGGTTFDESGKAFGSAPFFGATPTDPGDYYAEGWTFAFWHYGVESPERVNPYGAGDWSSTDDGIHTRDLVDGSWDSWAFEGSTAPPFTAFAENPTAAPPPFPPGDFNSDGAVDDTDYDVWAGNFGSTTQPAADANSDGIVDAADYVTWRNQVAASSAISSSTSFAHVPEPSAIAIVTTALCLSQFVFPWRRRMNVDKRRFKRPQSASIRVHLLFAPSNLKGD